MRWQLFPDWMCRTGRVQTLSLKSAGLHADGQTPDGERLRQLLRQHDRLVLPAGSYVVDATLDEVALPLKSHRQLACEGERSRAHLHVLLTTDDGRYVPTVGEQPRVDMGEGVVIHTYTYV